MVIGKNLSALILWSIRFLSYGFINVDSWIGCRPWMDTFWIPLCGSQAKPDILVPSGNGNPVLVLRRGNDAQEFTLSKDIPWHVVYPPQQEFTQTLLFFPSYQIQSKIQKKEKTQTNASMWKQRARVYPASLSLPQFFWPSGVSLISQPRSHEKNLG